MLLRNITFERLKEALVDVVPEDPEVLKVRSKHEVSVNRLKHADANKDNPNIEYDDAHQQMGTRSQRLRDRHRHRRRESVRRHSLEAGGLAEVVEPSVW